MLRIMHRSRDGAAQLDVELQQERAAALGRIARELESRLRRLRELACLVMYGQPSARVIAAYEAAYADASTYRWYLEVQREAIGLNDHGRLDEFYRVPARIRFRATAR